MSEKLLQLDFMIAYMHGYLMNQNTFAKHLIKNGIMEGFKNSDFLDRTIKRKLASAIHKDIKFDTGKLRTGGVKRKLNITARNAKRVALFSQDTKSNSIFSRIWEGAKEKTIQGIKSSSKWTLAAGASALTVGAAYSLAPDQMTSLLGATVPLALNLFARSAMNQVMKAYPINTKAGISIRIFYWSVLIGASIGAANASEVSWAAAKEWGDKVTMSARLARGTARGATDVLKTADDALTGFIYNAGLPSETVGKVGKALSWYEFIQGYLPTSLKMSSSTYEAAQAFIQSGKKATEMLESYNPGAVRDGFLAQMEYYEKEVIPQTIGMILPMLGSDVSNLVIGMTTKLGLNKIVFAQNDAQKESQEKTTAPPGLMGKIWNGVKSGTKGVLKSALAAGSISAVSATYGLFTNSDIYSDAAAGITNLTGVSVLDLASYGTDMLTSSFIKFEQDVKRKSRKRKVQNSNKKLVKAGTYKGRNGKKRQLYSLRGSKSKFYRYRKKDGTYGRRYV